MEVGVNGGACFKDGLKGSDKGFLPNVGGKVPLISRRFHLLIWGGKRIRKLMITAESVETKEANPYFLQLHFSNE